MEKKREKLKIDYVWAFREVVSSHDFSGKSPDWVDNFVRNWIEGYVDGFLEGWANAKIEVACKMKQNGLAPEMIADCTGLEIKNINMMEAWGKKDEDTE